MGPLTAHRQATAMAQPAITAEIHQTLDVHRHFAPAIALDHAIPVAGIDHVGLGSDFDGVSDQLPEGMEDISKIPNLIAGLQERGFSDDDIQKILGGNTLRVMKQVEASAETSAQT